MRKEVCAICDKIVYVEQGDEFEWEPGAMQCQKMDRFFCKEHKPCCADNIDGRACNDSEDDTDNLYDSLLEEDEEEYDLENITLCV